MRFIEIIFFSLSVALFIIGVHQSFTVGIAESYWIFMLCFLFLLIYQFKKEKALPESAQKNADASPTTPPGDLLKGSTSKQTSVKKKDPSGRVARSNQTSRK
jgi:hypothetical protein